MDVMQQLRDVTQSIHRRLEDLPLAQALASGTISLSSYAALLRQLLHLHICAEGALASHPELGVYRPEMARHDIIFRDLRALGGRSGAPALDSVRQFGKLLVQWSAEAPVALLGCLYVLEGSRLGSLHLAKPLARAFNVPAEAGHGLDYHLDGSAQRPQLWRQFQQDMRTAITDERQAALVVAAALATFDALYELYASLPPLSVSTVQAVDMPTARPALEAIA